MPCYIVNMTSVVFQTKYSQLLFDALNRNKIKYQIYREKEIIFRDEVTRKMVFSIMLDEGIIKTDKRYIKQYQPLINKIKREYSKQVLMTVAKKKKWKFSYKQGAGKERITLKR